MRNGIGLGSDLAAWVEYILDTLPPAPNNGRSPDLDGPNEPENDQAAMLRRPDNPQTAGDYDADSTDSILDDIVRRLMRDV
jgi:hypothetical protein